MSALSSLSFSPLARTTRWRKHYPFFAALLFLVLFPQPLFAAQISEISDISLWEQWKRFFRFEDPAVRYALAGSAMLGINAGLLGSLLVLRKMALLGDTLSHAVLPGVAVGFLWMATKNPWAIFVGATVAGLVSTKVVTQIERTTKLKEDTALGIVLATFFALGICLITMMQRLSTGNKSGLNHFFFGQAAALQGDDLLLIGISTLATLLCFVLLGKEFLATSFDPTFSRSVGIPQRAIHGLIMFLLASSVVVSLQAVGIVLVCAMLITPAATAFLITQRFRTMLLLAAIIGVLSSVGGNLFSFLRPEWPTGPWMVLCASAFFGLTLLLAPQQGLIPRWWRQLSQSRRIQRENLLKALYHILENRQFSGEGISATELARHRREPIEQAQEDFRLLKKHGAITTSEGGDLAHLTPRGFENACLVVRNHRLWELYLTDAANYPSDHVHEDAEIVEHILGEEIVRQIEKRLRYPHFDPHGKPIPSWEDIRQAQPTSPLPSRAGERS